MKLNILAFGITKEIIGNTMLEYQLEEGASVEDLKAALMKSYPKMCDLANIMIAVNSSYAVNGQILTEKDEIALIPPVSGG